MTVEDVTEALKRRNTPAAFGLTEDELAAEFTRRHGGHLRYVALWGAWMHWGGHRWEREPTLRSGRST
jgi:phage/plasmid-associated DNA primase